MRLYKYLTESRSKEYSLQKITDIIQKNCSQAVERYKEGYTIYRASDTRGDYLVTQAGKGRKSAYSVGNHYTLWINNSELWDKFPNREIICASGERAFEHGTDEYYHVFPFDGAKIGICPAEDIWESFNTLSKLDVNADELNIFLNEVVGEAGEDWEEYKKAIKKLIPGIVDQRNISMPGSLWNIWNDWEESGENLYMYLTDLLDPKRNGFDLQSIKNYSVTYNDNKEVWTDSNCVLINVDSMNTISDIFE